MDSQLQIWALGGLVFELDSEPVELKSRKAEALVIYLARTRKPSTRERLAEMLWPNRPQGQALANLRKVLNNARRVGEEHFSTSRDTVGINVDCAYWLDVTDFEAKLEAYSRDPVQANISLLEDAIKLYRGDFLEGFLVDCPEFEDWAMLERDRLRFRVMDALDQLIAHHLAQKDYASGIERATQLLRLDLVREKTYRHLMQLLALSGQRVAAVAQYETCCRILDEELGIEPTAETARLYERIRTGNVPEPEAQALRLKSYAVRERIGSTEFAEVYRAYQPATGREVAVKALLRPLANQPYFIRNFEFEAQVIARLEHPFIVPLYDYWRDPDGAYLVMRYLPCSWQNLLQQGPLTLDETLRMGEQISSALAFAHRNGVFHKNVKPTNILLDEEGNFYLTDFAIARNHHSHVDKDHDFDAARSSPYTSPEQARGEPATSATDVYALGAVLSEALTALHVHSSRPDLSQSMGDPAAELAVGFREIAPNLPPGLDAVIRRALASNAQDRFGDVLEMARSFKDVFARADGVSSTARSYAAALHRSVAELPMRNPYKGLQAFAEPDAPYFCGRESWVDQLLERLKADGIRSRFVAVIGASGCGKSSALHAGLIPALRNERLPGSSQWFIAEMTPGAHPLEELEIALIRIAAVPGLSLIPLLRENERGLLRAVRHLLPVDDTECLLVIDQFEELFALEQDSAETSLFLDSICASVMDPRSPLRIVISLRADFLDRVLMTVSPFGDLVRQCAEIILPLTPQETERAVIVPAERVGLSLEAGLVATIVADVGKQPGSLPLLQYALTELFEQRDGGCLTLDLYQTVGGVKGALIQRTDQIFCDMDHAHQDAARQLFLRLVTLGEGIEDTRRRVLESELLELGIEHVIMREVFSEFGQARLLTFDHDRATRCPTVEIAHEALLREWPRLRTWLDESRDDIRLERLLAAASWEWYAADKNVDFLLRGSRLSQFEEWADASPLSLTRDERAYLEASTAERAREQQAEQARQELVIETQRRLADQQRRAARRLRYLVAGLAIFLAMALGLSAVALDREQDAQRAQATSEHSARVAAMSAAQAQRLALVNGARAALATGDMDTALALAVAANQLDSPPPEAQAVLADAAYAPGTVRVFDETPTWMEFSPDGRSILASYDSDAGVVLWDAATGSKIHEMLDHAPFGVLSARFSPDGHTAVSTSWNLDTFLWDLDTGRLIRRFERPTVDRAADELFWGLTFSPDGQTVFAPFQDHVIAWDVHTGHIIQTFPGAKALEGDGSIAIGIDVSPDGSRVITGSTKGTWILWDAATGEPIHANSSEHSEWTLAQFSPDGRLALTSSTKGPLILWDLTDYTILHRFGVGSDNLYHAAFSPDGSMVIAGLRLRAWDVQTGHEISLASYGSIVGNHDFINFSPDGHMILFDAQVGGARLWDLRYGAEVRRLTLDISPSTMIWGADFSPDLRTLIVSTSTSLNTDYSPGPFFLFDLATGQEIRRYEPIGVATYGKYTGQSGVFFSPDGHWFLSCHFGGQMILWNVATGEPMRVFTGHRSGVIKVDFSPDGRTFISSDLDGMAILWDVETGTLVRRFDRQSLPLLEVRFSSDGAAMFAGGADGSIIQWDVESGDIIRVFAGHRDPARSIDLSPDQRYMISGHEGGLVVLWDVASGDEVRQFTGHTATVTGVLFGQGGHTAFSGSENDVIEWDVMSGEALRRYPASVNWDGRLALTPNGNLIFVGHHDNTVHEYRVDSSDELMSWVTGNRYVRELTCNERQLYRLEPSCDPSGVYPTRTPYVPLPTAFSNVMPPSEVPFEAPSMSATITPTVKPSSVLAIEAGEHSGEVPRGGSQIWMYNGRANERLTVSVRADNPANWAARSDTDPTPPGGGLDTVLTIAAPDGTLLTLMPPGVPLPGSDDIEPGFNTDCLVTGLVLPLDGVYTFVISSSDYQGEGAYTLAIDSSLVP